MRSERNIGKSILVHFDGQNNAFFVRNKGKDNKNNYDELLVVRNNTIKISKKVLDKFGINVDIEEEFQA